MTCDDGPAAVASSPPFAHVYVHFPFCARKCPYCDFNSRAGRDEEIARYVAALRAEAESWRGVVRPRTIFVGGGTPTHAETSVLERMLDALVQAFGDEELEEFTLEANPGSLDAAKVRALRRAGVNRVSLGAQSFDDRHLATLERVHSAADTVRGVEILRTGGIERLSVDLILAIPGQTLADQARDVAQAVALAPEHVSAYLLTFEEGTAFTRRMRAGRLPAPQDERDLAHLHRVCEDLAEAGYERYEVSNFARAGAACRHNLAYWRNANWLGLGAGAHSHRRGVRWKNVDDPADYAARVERGVSPRAWAERVAPALRVFESLMMGLRLRAGVDLAALAESSGIDVCARWDETIQGHVAAGLMRRDGAVVSLTTRGFDVTDAVVSSFLEGTADQAG